MDARPGRIRLEYRAARSAAAAARGPGRWRSAEPFWVAAMIGAAGIAVVSYGLLVVTFLATVVYERFIR